MKPWEAYGISEEEYNDFVKDMAEMETAPHEGISPSEELAMEIDFLTIEPSVESDIDRAIRINRLIKQTEILRNHKDFNAHYTTMDKAVASLSKDMGMEVKDVELAVNRNDFTSMKDDVIGNIKSIADRDNLSFHHLVSDKGMEWEDLVEGIPNYEDYFEEITPVRDEMDFARFFHDKIQLNEQWTPKEVEDLNKKIRKEFGDLEENMYVAELTHEADIAMAEQMDYIREQEGFQGDEPDIPAYLAEKLSYGQSETEMKEEIDANYREYIDNYAKEKSHMMEDLYQIEVGGWAELPKGLDSWFDDKTYETIGSDYDDYLNKRIEEQSYGDFNPDLLYGHDNINLSKEVIEKPINKELTKESEKTVDLEKPKRSVPNHMKEMLNSVEDGVSNPDYDFDEYD